MGFYEELGITRYINAHDTYTIYGGSRMSERTLRAMREAAESFVDMEELQNALGDAIAEMTKNEGAYVCNGAAGGLMLCAAVCMTDGDLFKYSRLPDATKVKNEIIIMRCQRNAYDKAVEAGGAKVVEIGDADETLEYDLEGSINERTAAVFYFESSNFKRASMPLEEVIRIAHKHQVPVVVDAAAQLPPVENLWKFTKMGADLVIFSGGKTLCGPQDSGLILGKEKYIAACRKLGAPNHGICRSSKVSREAMAGLYQALKDFLALDFAGWERSLYDRCKKLRDIMDETGIFTTRIVDKGPVGQTYPRVFGRVMDGSSVQTICKLMRQRHIYIGIEPQENSIYFSPLNLTEEETDLVGRALLEVLEELKE
jgi:L-seryl-tRNA(Ser) seleniumtransferase